MAKDLQEHRVAKGRYSQLKRDVYFFHDHYTIYHLFCRKYKCVKNFRDIWVSFEIYDDAKRIKEIAPSAHFRSRIAVFSE